MRGFPLLSTMIVVALLAVARQPLYRTIAVEDSLAQHEVGEEQVEERAEGRSDDGEGSDGNEAATPALVRIVGTGEIRSVRVEHLGKVIIEKSGGSSFEQDLPGLSVPSEGIEFWVEAKFARKDKRVALSIEIETDTGDVWKRTLWGEDGAIVDSVRLVRE